MAALRASSAPPTARDRAVLDETPVGHCAVPIPEGGSLTGGTLDARAIADPPAVPRDSAKLMVVHRSSGKVDHARVRDLPNWNHDNPEVDDYLIKAGLFWLEAGADGLRCDYALGVREPFWQKPRAASTTMPSS